MDPARFSEVVRRVRGDYRRHGSDWRNRSVWALAVYRFGVWSMHQKSPLVRKLTSGIYSLANVWSEIVTGVTMDRNVKLGQDFLIIHAATIFIHCDSVLGDRCAVMHNVTLGTNMGRDVPVLGNDVFVGAGATILGKVRIGDGARIGANSLVINDVPPGAFAVGVPARNMQAPKAWKDDANERKRLPDLPPVAKE